MKYNTQKKFQIYNALFLNLSYKGANEFGELIPILGSVAKQKFEEGLDAITIFDQFYEDYKNMIDGDKIDFMFKVIQYVERQIVLFDSIEDSISPYELEDQNNILIDTHVARCRDEADYLNLMRMLNEFSVRIVLTAHPTQFYRPPVLNIIARLRDQVKNNELEQVDVLLHQLGLTSLVNTKSPSPIEEANNIIHICRYEYYEAIGSFVYDLTKKLPTFGNENIVVLGFWPCGDRDGNPFVTHDVTREVIDNLRMTLMKCYYNDIKELKAQLTFRGIEETLGVIQSELYDAMFSRETSVDIEEIVIVLQEMRELLKDEYQNLYHEALDRIIVKMQVFKNHFASLDIRQDHRKHKSCIQEILKGAGKITDNLDELSHEELIRLLTEEFVEIPEEEKMEGLVLDTVRNIRQLPYLQEMNGQLGCHRYIISNSEDIFSVLFVFGMFRWIHKTDDFNFDIIPLFETMNGMLESEGVMRFLYNLKPYNDHLQRRNNKQTIMLGFSDGTKDGGYLKANWSIYKCKEVLSKVSKQNGISAVFFDGRGGPPARGGGKTFNFYAARSKDIANSEIQLTIQGQTITSTYGTKEKFNFNAEQMISSGLMSLRSKGETEISDTQRQLIEELSEISYEKYIDLKNHPMFLPYLEKMTTLKFYGRTRIGSRPAKRNQSDKLSLSDLRAISYVGSWSQLKQNIPGYYGVGTALSKLDESGKLDELKDLYQNVPLFRTFMDNSMMSLTKCYFELTSYMQSDDEFGDFWKMLHEEYKLSKEMMLKISDMSFLMETEQRSRQSIMIRDSIVRPLLLIQHYALQQLNTKLDPELSEIYEKLVVRSLYGNINASRNSA